MILLSTLWLALYSKGECIWVFWVSLAKLWLEAMATVPSRVTSAILFIWYGRLSLSAETLARKICNFNQKIFIHHLPQQLHSRDSSILEHTKHISYLGSWGTDFLELLAMATYFQIPALDENMDIRAKFFTHFIYFTKDSALSSAKHV